MLENFEGIRVLVNADDFLLAGSVDHAIIQLFKEGAISNTTAMMCLPQSVQSLSELKYSINTYKIGVHLQLTSGKPILKDVLSLIDRKTQSFAPKENLSNTRADEVEREWRAQIDLFCRVIGHPPSHLDSHHGPHRLSHLLPIYLKLASEFGVPVRGGTLALGKQISMLGCRSTAICTSDWTGRGQSSEKLMEKVLHVFSVEGPTTLEIVTHPSLFDPELRKISSLNDTRFNDYSELRRFRELVDSEPKVKMYSYEAKQ
ncbi:MAG: ChbG/HpnK family deacetylase [Paracoccaceae bacterium]|nr:ChbG/HpnK family deacetylase [Paracoccaceae bacterium]